MRPLAWFYPARMPEQWLFLLWTLALFAIASAQADPLTLHGRHRELLPGSSNRWQTVERTFSWEAARTAVVVCDMWDRHWCPDATERVGEMAPVMNAVISAARQRGVFIIHCPSDTMGFYADHPGRKLAQAAPKVETRVPLQGWCSLQADKEAPLPIDDSDGGCDGCPDCPSFGAWKRQHPAIEIQEGDAITDSAEAFYLMRQRGITNVIVMGVHENMCVLGRPFSIRQMVAQGQNVVLMRDMTDTMYNHRRAPYVSHFVGTELVCEHIEKYWCPSITSVDLLGGEPFRFHADRRPRVAIVTGENEYGTAETLSEWASAELTPRGVEVSWVQAPAREGDPHFTNEAAIASADAILLSVRRRTPPLSMMESLRRHLQAGKPLVGIRTASHAFDATPVDAAHAAWPKFDLEILGAHYQGHYGNKPPQGPRSLISTLPAAAQHPIVAGWRMGEWAAGSHLYKYRDLAGSVTVLWEARLEGSGEREPVAWVNEAEGRRVFYCSLGSREDFQIHAFRQMLLKGLLWALREPLPPPAPEPVNYQGEWQPMAVPGTWEEKSDGRLANYDGFAWYRCEVEWPEDWRGQPMQFEIGQVDNAQETYWDGHRLGSTGSLPPNYVNGVSDQGRYEVPADLTRGRTSAVVAIRVYDQDGRGGFKGAAPRLVRGTQELRLSGTWDFRTGDDLAWSKPDQGAPKARFRPPAASTPVVAPANPAPAAGPVLDIPQEAKSTPLPPAEAARRFQVDPDLVWEQVLAEPLIAQPVFLNFDERGRLWVVEYRQYPWPAGLKLVSRDSVWRNVYDQVPPAPPRHFKGADRITIHEDTDGDGTYDKHTVFVEGLNITTAVERGRGGVWVLNPPYLLFYPDADGDDVPDRDPEVRLAGFGLEDTHAVANSLRWGPDGWLYGAQGSTVTGNILVMGPDGHPLNAKPIYSQGQNIWRYHPGRRIYEVFSEGGGNAFGCELDAQGRIFSGHNGGDTRGFHYMQGAYLQKGFEKHGPLSNPAAFGFFPPMAHHSVPRFTHTFLIYEADALPARCRGHLFGAEPIQGRIVEAEITPVGSTFQTRDVGRPVVSEDRWFRPVDVKLGPDGAIYVCDWYDQQVNHYRNHEGRMDASNGRVYRLRAKGARPGTPRRLDLLGSGELVKLLRDPNRWTRQTVQRLLADRRDTTVLPELLQWLRAGSGQEALEALWAVYQSGAWDDTVALAALEQADPGVRAWTVRLLCDAGKVTPAVASRLGALALTEPNVEVRAQLACSAKRLPAPEAMTVVRGLVVHDADAQDPRVPLLIWWALESKCESDSAAVLQLLDDASFWSRPLVKQQLLARLARRFALSGRQRDLLVCAKIFDRSLDASTTDALMSGFQEAYKGRPLSGLPGELRKALTRHRGVPLSMQLRQGEAGALERALRLVADDTTPRAQRLELIAALGEMRQEQVWRRLLEVLRGQSDDVLRQATLLALQSFDAPEIGAAVVGLYTRLGPESLPVAQSLLTSRPLWARQLVETVAAQGGRGAPAPAIPTASVPLNVVRKIQLFRDPELKSLAEKVWPGVGSPTTAEMEARIARTAGVIRGGTGDPYAGRTLFQNTCAPCHRLFGSGAEVGPDLTVYKRDDLATMLLSIINPSAEIREGYEGMSVETKDGRSLAGFVVEKNDQVVVLRGTDGQNTVLDRREIESLEPSKISLMPEGLLDAFTEKQIRDLFAYLRSTQPLVGEPPKP